MSSRVASLLTWSLSMLGVAMFLAIVALYLLTDPRRKCRAA
jgi:uncharacterized membrane protein